MDAPACSFYFRNEPMIHGFFFFFFFVLFFKESTSDGFRVYCINFTYTVPSDARIISVLQNAIVVAHPTSTSYFFPFS